MIDYLSIRRVHLEISTLCNASCTLCPRNVAGYDGWEGQLGYPLHDMRLNEAKIVFPPEFIKQLDHLLINGNFGDFVMAREGLEIVEYFYSCNPTMKIEISTNGGAKPNIWERLGRIPTIEIGFALDGLDDTHSLYRQNTSWTTVISNAKKFIAAGGKARWRMIKFDHNKHQRDQCEQMSKDLGFYAFEMLDDGRNTGPVYDKNGDFAYQMDPGVMSIEYPKRVETWREWTKLTPAGQQSQYELIPIKQTVTCRAKTLHEIYVTATGEVYPCCWLGFYPKTENLGLSWQFASQQTAAIALNNNAHKVGIEGAILWFNGVEANWSKASYTEGRMLKCDMFCGSNPQ